MMCNVIKREATQVRTRFGDVGTNIPEAKHVRRRRREPSSVASDLVDKHILQVDQTTTTAATNATVKRSSRFRGVSRHRWTGRFEAHLWDKGYWNAAQRKKGKQVYLGAFDDEEAAARTYDLAAMKYWGTTTFTNFQVSDYEKEIELMQNMSKEEYLASLRRRSSGFSRGVSKFRGVARHHHNGRWEARIGRVFGNKYLYLGTYKAKQLVKKTSLHMIYEEKCTWQDKLPHQENNEDKLHERNIPSLSWCFSFSFFLGTQEEAAHAYDIAAIEYRGINAVTNFDLNTYIRWLRPDENSLSAVQGPRQTIDCQPINTCNANPTQNLEFPMPSDPNDSRNSENTSGKQEIFQVKPLSSPTRNSSSPTALGLLLRSSMFKDLVEKNARVLDDEIDHNKKKKQFFVGGSDGFGGILPNDIGSSGLYMCTSSSNKLPALESEEDIDLPLFQETGHCFWDGP